MNVNKIDKRIQDVTTLIHIISYSTDEQNLEKKIGEKISGLVTTTALNTKLIKYVENQIPNLSDSVNKTDYDAEI